jgi:hypothetical protein
LRLCKSLNSNDLDPQKYFRSILFIDLISQMEIFITDIVREVIKLHPRKAGEIKFSLNTIMDSADNELLVTMASEEILYKSMTTA